MQREAVNEESFWLGHVLCLWESGRKRRRQGYAAHIYEVGDAERRDPAGGINLDRKGERQLTIQAFRLDDESKSWDPEVSAEPNWAADGHLEIPISYGG